MLRTRTITAAMLAAFAALSIAGNVQAQTATTTPVKKPQAARPALSGEAALR